jgi:hypothetical protein
MHRSSVFEFDFTREDYKDSETRVESRFAVQCDALQAEVSVCRFWQDGPPEASRTHQLVNLLTASTSAFDSLKR